MLVSSPRNGFLGSSNRGRGVEQTGFIREASCRYADWGRNRTGVALHVQLQSADLQSLQRQIGGVGRPILYSTAAWEARLNTSVPNSSQREREPPFCPHLSASRFDLRINNQRTPAAYCVSWLVSKETDWFPSLARPVQSCQIPVPNPPFQPLKTALMYGASWSVCLLAQECEYLKFDGTN